MSQGNRYDYTDGQCERIYEKHPSWAKTHNHFSVLGGTTEVVAEKVQTHGENHRSAAKAAIILRQLRHG